LLRHRLSVGLNQRSRIHENACAVVIRLRKVNREVEIPIARDFNTAQTML
jgi:hypothetical protein